MKKIIMFLKQNILKFEMTIIALSLCFSIILQICVYKLDLTQIVPWEWVYTLYNWIRKCDISVLLEELDKLAIVVGGLSFVTEKWTEKDTENIVYMLVMFFSIILSKVFNIVSLHIMSFVFLCVNVILILIPIICIIYDCLKDSHNQDLKRSKIVR